MSNRNGHNGENHRFDDAGGRRRKRRKRPSDAGSAALNGRAHRDAADEPWVPPPIDDHPTNGSSHGAINGSGESKPADAGSSNRRNLSEISHLFLSDLRQSNGEGRTLPQRIPPQRIPPQTPPAAAQDDHDRVVRREITVDLTPDEFHSRRPAADDDADDMSIPPVCAVIGAKLNGTLIRRACQYASGLAHELPVGLVIVEATEVRLMWVMQGDEAHDNEAPESLVDPQRLHAALLEMSCDIGRWLVVLPDTRLPQARRLLAGLREWVLLAPADQDGVVASYRVLKGLCDLELPEDEADGPSVTLALVDAADAGEAQRHARKLTGVCKQFLDLEINAADVAGTAGPAAGAVSKVGAYTAREVVCAGWPDTQAAGVAWPVLEQVLLAKPSRRDRPAFHDSVTGGPSIEMSMFNEHSDGKSRRQIPDSLIPPMARPAPAGQSPDDLDRLERRLEPRTPKRPLVVPVPEASDPVRRRVMDIEVPDLARPPVRATGTPPRPENTPAAAPVASSVGPRIPEPAPAPVRRAIGEPLEMVLPPLTLAPRAMQDDEVIDLPIGESVADVVLSRMDVAMTPVYPPMLPEGRLCVSRSGAVLLVAGASPGLTDLPLIGRAITWATENRLLLRMALAQYRLDDAAEVSLHLLVSRADANAEALRPLLSTGRVTVQTYRRLTWGGRCGVLLEAA